MLVGSPPWVRTPPPAQGARCGTDTHPGKPSWRELAS